MTSHFHNKYHHSAYIRQFISKSSHVDRFTFTDDSEPDVKSLIKNLKNIIMKKLLILCMTESSVSSLASSTASFSAASLSVSFSAASQSSTLASVSGSPAPATSVLIISGFTVSAFITSSPHFKEMLCRLNKPCLSRIISLLNRVKIKIVMSFIVYEVVMFTDIKKLFITIKFNIVIASASETILIKDDNAAKTTLFHS
ncbi:uncharacterized protein BDCG_02967 [Blastomyces dermatitidis ER-3]|uniref:Uncharacterized protein n=1 Tax=Ajellomyces dermatitidis (strain ER-3 / ATCC MYA-2586) TaxID=559297 RepID=A0ABM9YGY5_AJEDR|nr:uncharacterized protein BDCG_02967 [Blastomyces dermatitidis ER-3]EEQ87847.2 hypothetical protein BDCG_02967 [Blastomyces dermatitidis ER-3]